MPDIQIPSLDGASFQAYAALPAGGNGPAIIVAHEIFGVNESLRRICDDLAAQGYIAVCPDLFWRQEAGVQLSEQSDVDWEHAQRLYKGFDVEAGVRDLLATLAFLRRMPGCSGKVGALGYSIGGRLAYLMASRSDVDCCVSYYPVGIDALLDEVYDIRMPYLIHFAEQDKFISQAARQKIAMSVSRNPVIAVETYPNVDHGFARPDGQKYNPPAATKANDLTLAFLKKNLMA